MAKPSTVDDRGETLVELLVAIAILATAVVAVVGGIGTAITMSDVHRKQATAGSYLRDFAEAVENKISATPTGYAVCPTVSVTTAKATYQAAYSIPDSTHYTATVTGLAYWNGTAFVSSCPSGGDVGVQRVSLNVSSKDIAAGHKASESMDIIIRRPCRSATDFPLDTPC
jgi:type II secretory pathway pseudopilin PulG